MKAGRFLIFSVVIVLSSHCLLAQETFKVRGEFSDGTRFFGFGFTVYETEEHFYLITAKHVVESDLEGVRVKEIYIIRGNNRVTAEIYSKNDSADLALLIAERSNFQMQLFRNSVTKAEIGDPVYIVGRYGELFESETGRITKVGPTEIEAELEGVAPGSSGGPLRRRSSLKLNDKIVGMVYRDDGSTVKAIPIHVIRKFTHEALKLDSKLEQISDLPILQLGVQLPLRYSVSNEFSPIKDYYNARNSDIGLNLFLDIAMMKNVSIQLERNWFTLRANTSANYLEPVEFKNSIATYSLGFKFYPVSNLHKANPFLKLGYSWGRMKPLINSSNTRWVELSELGHEYSRSIKSIDTGFGFDVELHKHYVLGFSIEYEQFLNKYIYSNIIYPSRVNTKNDWFILFEFKLGLKFRRPEGYVKFLR